MSQTRDQKHLHNYFGSGSWLARAMLRRMTRPFIPRANELDPFKILIGWFMGHTPPIQKYRNTVITFGDILQTHRDRYNYITSSAEAIKS